MPKTIIKLPTWRCPECDYAQDFDPTDDALMELHFPGYPKDHCPACHSGLNDVKQKKACLMEAVTDPEKMTTVTIMGEEEVDEMDLSEKEKSEKITEIRASIDRYKVV